MNWGNPESDEDDYLIEGEEETDFNSLATDLNNQFDIEEESDYDQFYFVLPSSLLKSRLRSCVNTISVYFTGARGRVAIRNAIQQYHTHTCLRFHPRNREMAHIRFYKGNG